MTHPRFATCIYNSSTAAVNSIVEVNYDALSGPTEPSTPYFKMHFDHMDMNYYLNQQKVNTY